MTKKDFEEIALVISRIKDVPTRWEAADAFADHFLSTYPSFNAYKFLQACKGGAARIIIKWEQRK